MKYNNVIEYSNAIAGMFDWNYTTFIRTYRYITSSVAAKWGQKIANRRNVKAVYVSLSGNTVTISGTPTSQASGTYNYSIIINNSKLGTDTEPYISASSSTTITGVVNVNIPDTTPPVITLNGQSSITLTVGDTYTEQGATANDNVDGNISNNIVTTGTVNTSTPSTYTVTYTVTDAASNTSSIVRTVTVNTPPVIYFENGTCKCPNASVGDTLTINGILYTVVDNSTLATELFTNGNDKLCTTFVTTMYTLFSQKNTFNTNIGFWDTSNVTNMGGMFQNARAFNQDIGNWDVGNVTNFQSMFSGASSFNQDLSTWNVSSATNMNGMFYRAENFNQNIGNWDVSNATLDGMFNDATLFNQDLSSWCVSHLNTPSSFSLLSSLSNSNKPLWGYCPSSYTLNVTASSSSDYTLSGSDRTGNISGSDPNLTFSIGDTIDFVVDASGHPFYLKTVQGTGTSDLISGVTNNGATNGTVSWTPSATGTYYYQCSLHNGMYGTITVN